MHRSQVPPRVAGPSEALPVRALTLGVEDVPAGCVAVPWRSIDIEVPGAMWDRPLQASRAGLATVDTSPVLDSDAVVLRGWYATSATCLGCDAVMLDPAAMLEHGCATGHPWRRPSEAAVRVLVEEITRRPALLRGRALVYELDADPWRSDAGGVPGPAAEQDLVRALLATADVLVVRGEPAERAAHREGRPDASVVRIDGAPAGSRADAWRAAAAGTPRGARRQQIRARDVEVGRLLATAHTSGEPAWPPGAGDDPLVSVVIPVVDEPDERVARAIASVLEGVRARVEVLVVGAPGRTVRELAPLYTDQRLSWLDAASAPDSAAEAGKRGDPVDRERRRATALACGMDGAHGAWVAWLSPAAVWVPNQPGLLVDLALENQLELVYGQELHLDGDAIVEARGGWPPGPCTLAPDALVVSASLAGIRPDPGAPAEGETATGNLLRRYLAAGARAANAEVVLALRDAPFEDLPFEAWGDAR
jgi:hypothetical protein